MKRSFKKKRYNWRFSRKLRRQKGGKKTKAYLINLDKRPEKWEKSQDEFKDTNIVLERISAIENDNGQIGLGFTFQKIIQLAKEQNLPAILILEDDNKLLENFNENWKITKEWLDNHIDNTDENQWDVFNGGPILDSGGYIDYITKLKNNIHLYRCSSFVQSNFLYFNKRIYDAILNWDISKGNPDMYIGNLKNFKNICIYPFLATQYPGVSDTMHIEMRNETQWYKSNEDTIKKLIEDKEKQSGGEKTKAYVINLDNRTDRWDQIQNDFKDTDIVLERISAVENNNGHYGCSKSIQKAVQIGKDNNLEYIIIFEDDNTPTENFNTNWPIIKEWLDNDTEWDIFNGAAKYDGEYEGKLYKSLENNMNLYEMKMILTTNCICVNKKAYDRVLDYDYESILTNPVQRCIDRYIGNGDNFKVICCYPFIGTQRSSYSNIRKNNINNKNEDIIQKEKFENFIKTLQTGGQICLISYFTVSTKDTPELQRLKSSAEKFGWNLEILGLEANTDQLGWEDKNNKSGDYGNFSIKLVKELKYVSSKSPDDIVLFTDAWDVICLGDCNTLYEKFLTFNKDLVFGAEKECSPDKDKIDIYRNKDVIFPYLNSGFFIGKAGVIKKYLDTYNGEKINDQKWWTAIYLDNQDDIALDTNAVMCLQTWATDEKYYQIQDNKFTYTETNTNPIFIHANGHIKDKLSLFTQLIQNGGNRPKAYVMNLEKRSEKWDKIQEDFKDIFDLERFNAIHDTIGHRGCGKSFQALISMAKEKNMEEILILEDDCKPLDNFKERWDIIKQWLDDNKDKWEVFNGGISVVQGAITHVIHKIDDNNVIKSIDKGVNCHMILVKNDAYDKILEWDWDKNWLIDFNYINTSKFKTLFVEPSLCIQTNGYSNTEHKIKKNNVGGRRKTRKHKMKRLIGGNEEQIHYITVSTKDTPELQRLLDSGKKFKWDIKVLGLEMDTTEFRNMDIYNRNFQMKLYLVKDYLKNLNDNDIVLFSDAWDVVVIGTKETILEKYKKFKKPIVISAEKTCWPDKDRANEYDTLEEPFPYINSGGYIGTVKALKTIFENYNNEENTMQQGVKHLDDRSSLKENTMQQGVKHLDDQRFWTNMYFKYRDLIGLDTKAEIFLSLFDTNVSNYNFDNKIFTYKETNTNPIIIHGNGHHKDKLNNFNIILQNGGNKQKAYVINLEKRPEKWEQIQKDFKDTNLELERFSAIVNENPYVGIGTSFQALIRLAKEKNMDHIIILEDDCHPIGKFNQRWSEIYNWLMNNKDKWEIFNGGIQVEYGRGAKELKYEVNKKVYLYTSDGNVGNHFMIFNKSSYDKVLEWWWDNPNQQDKHFDWYTNTSKYFKFLYVEPPIALQRDGQSNTEPLTREYTKNNSIQSRKKKRENLNNTIGGGNIKNIYISCRSENTRLGDALFCMIYFFNIKDYLNENNIQINFYIRSQFLDDIKEFSIANINFFDIDKKPLENVTDFWVGNTHEGLNLDQLNPTKCWSIFLKEVFSYIGKQMNLPPIQEFSYTDPTLLEIYNNLDDKYKNVDILIINGKPTSNQLNYKDDEWNLFCKNLSLLYKIVTTDKVDTIQCTRDDNLSVKNIAAISTKVKYIIAVNTGPIVACYNTYALQNVKKWYIFDNTTQYKLPNFIMNKSFNDILNDLKI